MLRPARDRECRCRDCRTAARARPPAAGRSGQSESPRRCDPPMAFRTRRVERTSPGCFGGVARVDLGRHGSSHRLLDDPGGGAVTLTKPAFEAVTRCWICDGGDLAPIHEAAFELSIYVDQDPELAAYTGQHISLVRCAWCGFAQPGALPALDEFFSRMYDQRWSPEWMAREYASAYKDVIFRTALHGLARRLSPARRALLDLGAHVGRLMHLA